MKQNKSETTWGFDEVRAEWIQEAIQSGFTEDQAQFLFKK